MITSKVNTSGVYKALCLKQVEFTRSRYEKLFNVYFRKVLNKQFKELSNKITFENYQSDALVNNTITKEPIQEMFLKCYQTVGVEFANATYKSLRTQKSEPDKDDWHRYMDNYVRTRTGNRIVSIAEKSREQAKKVIRTVIEESFNEGWGAEETARNIKKGLVDTAADINQWRALRIARTEVIGASNAGSYAGAETVAKDMPLVKYWIATTDERTRPDHLKADADSPKDMEEAFIVGGVPMQFPGDPDGLPEDIINCRCTIAYGVKGM